jgi:hypothetical protein
MDGEKCRLGFDQFDIVHCFDFLFITILVGWRRVSRTMYPRTGYPFSHWCLSRVSGVMTQRVPADSRLDTKDHVTPSAPTLRRWLEYPLLFADADPLGPGVRLLGSAQPSPPRTTRQQHSIRQDSTIQAANPPRRTGSLRNAQHTESLLAGSL